MNSADPESKSKLSSSAHALEVAIREIVETRRLLSTLITSSESFNYPLAKAALHELQLKIKVLARLESELTTERGCADSDRIVSFPAPTRARA